MRVNPNIMPDVLGSLSQTQQLEQTALMQMSSGQRINKPSDDPAGAAVVTQIHDRNSQNDSFQRSISSVTGQLSMADSTLSSVISALQRAITLGVQGANGTLSDSNRAAVAAELTGIQKQLVSLGNTSYQGQYLFAGTAAAQPFVFDPNTASGVRYDGDTGVNVASVGQGYQVDVNVPGSQLFAQPGSDMFQSIQDLITALNNNTGADAAVAGVRKAFDYLSAERVFYGNGLNQLDAQGVYLQNESVQLSQQEKVIAGADLAQVASDVANTSTARTATLEALAKVGHSSLFDYLR